MAKASSNKSELNVLVVDDDENIRLVLQKTIIKQGYHVSTARNAEEALNMLQRSFFHVVNYRHHDGRDEWFGIDAADQGDQLANADLYYDCP